MNINKQYGYFEVSAGDFPEKTIDEISQVLFDVQKKLREYIRQLHPELLVKIEPQILPQKSINNIQYYRAGWCITIGDYSNVKVEQFYTALFFDSAMERFHVKDSSNGLLTLVADFKRMKEYYD